MRGRVESKIKVLSLLSRTRHFLPSQGIGKSLRGRPAFLPIDNVVVEGSAGCDGARDEMFAKVVDCAGYFADLRCGVS